MIKPTFIDFILISDQPAIEARCSQIAEEFNFCFSRLNDLEELFSQFYSLKSNLLILSLVNSEEKDAGGQVQVARQMYPDAFIVTIISKKLDSPSLAYVKKCGASLILVEDEVSETTKLEFILVQVIKATFISIKSYEVKPGIIDFNLYHLLPLRKKFLPCFFAEDFLSVEKCEKIKKIGEIYIHRQDVDKFKNYCERTNKNTAEDLSRRCRAQFLALYVNYTEMVFILTDQSEYSSFKEGLNLLNKCRKISTDLAGSLASLGNAWEVINNSTIGEIGSIERSPAISAYVCLIGLLSDMPNLDDIMLATLLSNLGLIFIHPNTSKKIRNNNLAGLTEAEREEYENHPIKSLNIALERKLPIDAQLRKIITATHEKCNGTGFPRQILADKIPEGSQLIQFCEQLDQITALKMGQARVDNEKTKETYLEKEFTSGSFSPELLNKIRNFKMS